MTPARTLSRLIRRLRYRFLARRAVEILAIALVLELFLDAFATGVYLLFGAPLRVRFTLEALLSILLVQAAVKSREGAFARHLDRDFGLKDRLASHLNYRQNPAVPPMLREAQAMECLRSLDFEGLARRVGPRFPPSLFLTIPLFAALTFLYLDAPVTPPGPIGRAALSLLAPERGAAPAPESHAASQSAPADDKVAEGTALEASSRAVEASAEPAPKVSPGTGGDATDGKDAVAPERRGQAAAEPGAGPGTFQSFPVTSEVSSVAPAVLADESSGLDGEGFDPKRLLSLIPWPEAAHADLDLTRMARDVPTPGTNGYPVAYRNHIDRYFQEILAWETH